MGDEHTHERSVHHAFDLFGNDSVVRCALGLCEFALHAVLRQSLELGYLVDCVHEFNYG